VVGFLATSPLQLDRMGGEVMFELLIGAISLAIALGQVVAARQKERVTTVIAATIFGCVAIAGILYYQYDQSQRHERRIEHVANLVLNVMDRPQTFDDIYNRMDYPNYREVDEAFDLLFENGRYEHQVVQMQGPNNEPHLDSLYFKK